LEGIHRTAQAHGPTAQELGYARQKIENLERELESLRTGTRRGVQQDPYADPYEQQSQPIDLRSEIKSTLRDFYRDEVIRPQQEASDAYWRDVESVYNSEYYPMVQDEYEAHVKSPAMQRALAQGKTTHTNEFHKIVVGKFKDISQQLKNAAMNLKEQPPKGTKPPHMETGQVPPEQLPEREEARRQQLKSIQENAQGRDDDIDALIKAFLPDDDPLVNT